MSRARSRKALLLGAFFQEHEVRQLLTQRGVHTPQEVEERMDRWKVARRQLEDAVPWADAERVEALEAPPELSARVDELSQSEELRTTVENIPYRVAVVSLGQLLAFQFTVDRPYSATFQVPASPTALNLADITLPTTRPKFPLRVAGDGAGVTLSAPGPNLRIAAIGVQTSDGGPLRFTVDLTFGSPFVQVAEFEGRMFLRNGYHRVVGLLAQGVSHAPVIVLQCADYTQTGAGGPGFFARHVLMGDKPPLLRHYLSPFAIEFNAADLHKTIRLRPDEFLVPVPE